MIYERKLTLTHTYEISRDDVLPPNATVQMEFTVEPLEWFNALPSWLRDVLGPIERATKFLCEELARRLGELIARKFNDLKLVNVRMVNKRLILTFETGPEPGQAEAIRDADIRPWLVPLEIKHVILSANMYEVNVGTTVSFTAAVRCTYEGLPVLPAMGVDVRLFVNRIQVAEGRTDVNGLVSFSYVFAKAGTFSCYAECMGVKSEEIRITVKAPPVPTPPAIVESISLTIDGATSLTVYHGTNVTMRAHVKMKEGKAEGLRVAFASNGTRIGESACNAEGIATATYTLPPIGRHVITAACGNVMSNSCILTVLRQPSPPPGTPDYLVPEPATPPPPQYSLLRVFAYVDGKPVNVDVSLDKVASGTTPWTYPRLEPGRSYLVAGSYAGVVRGERFTAPEAGGEITVRLEFPKPVEEGFIDVKAFADLLEVIASVYVNDVIKGTTPTVISVKPGTHTVKVVYTAGGRTQTYTRTVTVGKDETVEVRAEFTYVPTPLPPGAIKLAKPAVVLGIPAATIVWLVVAIASALLMFWMGLYLLRCTEKLVMTIRHEIESIYMVYPDARTGELKQHVLFERGEVKDPRYCRIERIGVAPRFWLTGLPIFKTIEIVGRTTAETVEPRLAVYEALRCFGLPVGWVFSSEPPRYIEMIERTDVNITPELLERLTRYYRRDFPPGYAPVLRKSLFVARGVEWRWRIYRSMVGLSTEPMSITGSGQAQMIVLYLMRWPWWGPLDVGMMFDGFISVSPVPLRFVDVGVEGPLVPGGVVRVSGRMETRDVVTWEWMPAAGFIMDPEFRKPGYEVHLYLNGKRVGVRYTDERGRFEFVGIRLPPEAREVSLRLVSVTEVGYAFIMGLGTWTRVMSPVEHVIVIPLGIRTVPCRMRFMFDAKGRMLTEADALEAGVTEHECLEGDLVPVYVLVEGLYPEDWPVIIDLNIATDQAAKAVDGGRKAVLIYDWKAPDVAAAEGVEKATCRVMLVKPRGDVKLAVNLERDPESLTLIVKARGRVAHAISIWLGDPAAGAPSPMPKLLLLMPNREYSIAIAFTSKPDHVCKRYYFTLSNSLGKTWVGSPFHVDMPNVYYHHLHRIRTGARPRKYPDDIIYMACLCSADTHEILAKAEFRVNGTFG